RCYGGRLDYGKKTPAVQEGDETAIGFFQIDILPASLRIHATELAIADSSGNGHEAGDYPNPNEPAGAADIPEYVSAHNKNPGSDHRSGHDHGCIPEAEYRFELTFVHKNIFEAP